MSFFVLPEEARLIAHEDSRRAETFVATHPEAVRTGTGPPPEKADLLEFTCLQTGAAANARMDQT